MSRSTRVLLAVLLLGFAGVVLGVGSLTLAAVRAGSVAVEVHEPGSEVSVAFPAALVQLGILLAPAPALRQALSDAEPYVPAVAAAWAAIERSADFTLVEVTGPEARVQVAKRDGRLIVTAHEGGSRVEVTIPLGTVRTLLHKLA
jgi:hypothetical protein